MSNLPGQPHAAIGTNWAASQLTAHEATVTGHSAPPILPRGPGGTGRIPLGSELAQFLGVPGTRAPSRPNRHHFSNTAPVALIPDKDPWRKLRRRLLGERDDLF